MKVSLLNSQAEPEARIEIVPLIDVIFCILTFFIIAALQLTRQQAINVNLPKASTAAIQTRQTLIVSVDSVGQLYVDRTPVSSDQLFLLLEGYRRTNPQGLMVLNADRSAVYEDVVKLLDLMRSVGGDRVALATQPQDGAAPGLSGGAGSTTPGGFGLPMVPPNGAAAPGGIPGSVLDPGAAIPGAPAIPGAAPGIPGAAPGTDSAGGLPNAAWPGAGQAVPAPGAAPIVPGAGQQ
jgi:biopolymer transport protein ExbD